MPAQKSSKTAKTVTPPKGAAKAATRPPVRKTASKPLEKPGKNAISRPVPGKKDAASKAPLKSEKPVKKVPPVPTKSPASTAKPAAKKEAELKVTPTTADTDVPVKKKPGRPPKNPAAAVEAGGAKRGRKPKVAIKGDGDEDMSDIEDDLVGEPVVETTEKVKPLRMKISKAKERALMKEFGLDETVLSEEDMAKRRARL